MIQNNKSLKNYNTFGVEAKADYFSEVSTVENLIEILKNKTFEKMPKLILGGGSNILLTKDFKGLAIKLNLKGKSIYSKSKNTVIVQANASENWHDFVLWTVEQNFGGLENLSLIPGNVGTAPMQNIGAYGREIKDDFYKLKALNLETFQIEEFNLEDCQFGYRESIFKRKLKGKYIILEVFFELKTSDYSPKTSYGAIEKELEQMKLIPSIKNVSQAVINIRNSKLPDPKKIGNSGSFFKNPVISIIDFKKIQENYPDIVSYPISETQVKVPAGWLIDRAGWKGKKIGNIGVHKNQALVLVNYGHGTGQEIYDLSQEIIQDIQEKYNITLEREVNIL